MQNKRAIGTNYEQIAMAYLQENNYRILEQNFRCRLGEIDIICIHEETLVFVEVKYRADNSKGYAGEAINYRKQSTIYKVAEYYIMTHNISEDFPCRFDAVLIDGQNISLVKNAFGGM